MRTYQVDLRQRLDDTNEYIDLTDRLTLYLQAKDKIEARKKGISYLEDKLGISCYVRDPKVDIHLMTDGFEGLIIE